MTKILQKKNKTKKRDVIILCRICWGIVSKIVLTDLDWIINNPQIRCDTSTQEQIKSCRLHPERKSQSLSEFFTCTEAGKLRYLPVHHNRLVHLIKEAEIRVPAWRNHSHSYSVFFQSSEERGTFWFVFTFCPVETCACGPAVGNVWTHAPASWPAEFVWAPCPAAGWPEGPMSGRTSNWTNDCPGSPAVSQIKKEVDDIYCQLCH